MKSIKLIAGAGLTGVVLAGAVVSPVFAWHPKGMINKSVQDVTASGQLSDANDAASAVSANSGDILKYVITVENDGAADSNGMNDMAKTVMTDTLPDGVTLTSDASKRTITEDLGTIKPGQKVTKEYLVKVTSTKNGDVIENKACFTGNSTANDNPQKGCDVAIVKVSVPKPTPNPTPTPKPTPTPQPQPQIQAASTELPNTGAGNFLVPAGAVSALGYAGNMLRLKRRARREQR